MLHFTPELLHLIIDANNGNFMTHRMVENMANYIFEKQKHLYFFKNMLHCAIFGFENVVQFMVSKCIYRQFTYPFKYDHSYLPPYLATRLQLVLQPFIQHLINVRISFASYNILCIIYFLSDSMYASFGHIIRSCLTGIQYNWSD